MSESKPSIDRLEVRRAKNPCRPEYHLCTRNGASVVEGLFCEAVAYRLAARWNACAGMSDPVEEVKALREVCEAVVAELEGGAHTIEIRNAIVKQARAALGDTP